MKLPKNSDRAMALIALLVSVMGLVMSPVSAAAAFSPSGDTTGTGIFCNSGYHHAFNSTQQAARLQTVLANLSQQGVDVSQVQADLAAGNTTGGMKDLMALYKDHPDLALNGPRQHLMNATAHAVHFQTLVTTLSQQGVDVSQVQADLAAGNTTGAMKDLMALHKGKGHPGMMANSTQMAARLQTGVSKLAQQGVDVSEVQADLASGNVSAAMQWMAAYRTAHPDPTGNGTFMYRSGGTQWQNGGSFRPHTPGFGNQTAAHHRFTGPVKDT